MVGRDTAVKLSPKRKRPSVLFDLWCLTAVFASAKRMRKLTANAIGGKDVSPQQVADALTFIRGIMVFPPLAQTYTKSHQLPMLKRKSGESVGFVECSTSGTEQITLSRPLGAIAANLDRLGRFGRLGAPAERLPILERI